MSDNEQATTEDQGHRTALIWDYHQMHHQLLPVDVAIGLGSHDLGVATYSADLYRAGLFPTLVFTDGNSPTTARVFPRGEAVHFREHAIGLGVPVEAILLEPDAGNAGQNITLSREVLAAAGITPEDGAAGLQALHGTAVVRDRP